MRQNITDVPVVILNWNGWDDTLACLQSLREHGHGCLVWLVDNGSELNRMDEARAAYPGLRGFRWGENLGWAGGYNRALRVAAREGHEFVYLLNNDCVVTPGFLRTTLKAAADTPSVAAVGSRVAYAADRPSIQFDGEFREAGEVPIRGGAPTVLAVPSVCGAGMLVRLSAFQRVGSFDERLFCYFEEIEWCWRAGDDGWEILLSTGSVVYHRAYGSDQHANALYYRARNSFLLRRRLRISKSSLEDAVLLYRALRTANNLRRAGRVGDARALASGLFDAVARRLGPRPEEPPWPIVTLLTHSWPFPSGFFRRRAEVARELVSRLAESIRGVS